MRINTFSWRVNPQMLGEYEEIVPVCELLAEAKGQALSSQHMRQLSGREQDFVEIIAHVPYPVRQVTRTKLFQLLLSLKLPGRVLPPWQEPWEVLLKRTLRSVGEEGPWGCHRGWVSPFQALLPSLGPGPGQFCRYSLKEWAYPPLPAPASWSVHDLSLFSVSTLRSSCVVRRSCKQILFFCLLKVHKGPPSHMKPRMTHCFWCVCQQRVNG